MAIDPNCPHCKGTGWVCEQHSDQPMGHDGCLGPGMPCELCAPDGELPGLPPGFVPVGQLVGEQPDDEAEHFVVCPDCGQAFDMRDLDEVLHHTREGHGPRVRD